MFTQLPKDATKASRPFGSSGKEEGSLASFGLSDNRPALSNAPVTPVIQMFRPVDKGAYKLKNGNIVHYRGINKDEDGKRMYKMYSNSSAAMGNWISEDEIEGPAAEVGSSSAAPVKPKVFAIGSVDAEPKKIVEPKESKGESSVSNQSGSLRSARPDVDLENTGLTFEECQQYGNKAIAYARKIIPHAGNQEEEYENDRMALASSELTKGLYLEFKKFASAYKGGEHRHLAATSIPPLIRRNIVLLTEGGTCGEYATLVYLYLKERGIPCKIVKSAEYGEHAWVMMRSKDGKDVCIDAWPTETREVVPYEQFFTTVNKGRTSSFHAALDLQEANEDTVNELWDEFWKGIIPAIRQVPETFEQNIDRFQFPKGTVRSTKRS